VPAPEQAALIHDWNAPERDQKQRPPLILDDTLRDGLQNAAVRQPDLEQKRELLRLMARAGAHAVNLGLPGSSDASFATCRALADTIAAERLPLGVVCAGRTVEADMRAIVALSEQVPVPIEAHTFVGASAIRTAVEGWDLELVKRRTAASLEILRRAGLPAVFVVEDATRTSPETLRALYGAALDAGATRLCLCDTVGIATPEGAGRLVAFTQTFLAERGAIVPLDWHGHNDRGLAVANALVALDAGVERVHATVLGIGERVGNVPLELVVLNLALLGKLPLELEAVADYCRRSAEVLGWTIPPNHPLVGDNAFRTATGVHAAAILKAERLGTWVMDRVYAGVPAAAVGRVQEIRVGAMSGRANVVAWLGRHGIEPSERLVRLVLDHARAADRILSDDELLEIVRQG